MPEPTLDELRAEALKALTTPEEKQEDKPDPAEEKAEPPRDDKGRFTKADAGDEETEEVVYERVIDLGDGSGTQVFRGKSMEELIDKLATAQENATRKIRELSTAQKAAIKQVEENDELTEDQKFILSQQILTDPMKVIQTFVEKAINKKVDPRLKEVEDVAREQRETKIAVEWVKNNPDYHACDSNGKKIQKYLETQGKEITPENLQAAFEDLSADGLLVSKPAEKQDAEDDTAETKVERIAPKAETVVRRKVVGGLSTKRQAQVEPKSPEPTEKDFQKMSTEELRDLALKAIRERS
jgi:hypothetical protein